MVCRPCGYHSATACAAQSGGPVGVALRACVRRADRCRQIGPRNAKAVIAPPIHDHVGLRRHVAVDALRAGAARLVVVMLGDVELRRHVALRAQRVALGAQRQAVRIVAVRAGDARTDACGSAGTSRIRTPRRRSGRRRGRGPAPAARADRHRATACPAAASLAITLRRAWHAAQASSSAEASGSVRCAMPVSGFISQWPWSVAFSQRDQAHPVRSESAAPACDCAQATWREPGPWQASHDTSTSDQVVA